jgi:ArsR family transcriptional regulator
MFEKYAQLFKVLGDENRLKIIELLIKGETCSCTLIDNLSISQPTLSYHLKLISEVGLAKSIREGNWVKYYINKDMLTDIKIFIEKIRDSEEEQCSL